MLKSVFGFFECGAADDDHGWCWTDSIRFENQYLELDLCAKRAGSELEIQRWRIRAQGVVDYRFQHGVAGEVSLAGLDHPVVRQHADLHCALSFHGRASSPHQLVGQLAHEHQSITSGWIEFGRYLNQAVDPFTLLDSGFGRVADGPLFLMDAYERTLGSFGIRTSRLPARRANQWDGARFVEVDKALTALLIGDNFVVASSLDELSL
jgi:hypothetical protein